jgi:F-type H+-transporting ATPase subunit b
MPQFNPVSFSSQLFWLAICFGLIYFSMSKIFLPRIRDILKDRHNNINHNESLTLKIQDQIDEISAVNKNLRTTSESQYKLAIDQSTKEAHLYKDRGMLDLKVQTTKMVEESKEEMAKFRQNSEEDSKKIIDQMVGEISNKLFESKI